MSEPFAPVGAPHPGTAGLSRLRSLIGRVECPPCPADELLSSWHRASGTYLPFEEWCDPAARALAKALQSSRGPLATEAAVVHFAQSRAGAEHSAEAVAADLIALLQLLHSQVPAEPEPAPGDDCVPDDRGASPSPSRQLTWSGRQRQRQRACTAVPQERPEDEVIRLVARALTAWAGEQVAVVSAAACTDPVTGLVTGGFLRARLRELHAQCDALAIAPRVTFGALVVQLNLAHVAVPERMGVRVRVSRALTSVFSAGETVAALGDTRFVVIMPAYALGRAESDLREAMGEAGSELKQVRTQCARFEGNAELTWRSLAGTGVGI